MAASRPTRHSYSSISLYKECPAKYRYRYIDKMADEPTAAMERGTRLHKLCEDYVNEADASVPYDLKRIGMVLYRLRERKAQAEQTWLVDRNWKPVTNPNKAMLKAIIDVHYMGDKVLYIHDYKSGREYPSHADQLELYAAIGLCVYPDAKRVEAGAIYIDSGKEGTPRSIIRDLLPGLRIRWGNIIEQMDDDDAFLPTAGGHCKRCAFGSSKGGPCTAEQRSV